MRWLRGAALLVVCTGVAGGIAEYRAAVVQLAPRGTVSNPAALNLELGLAAVDRFGEPPLPVACPCEGLLPATPQTLTPLGACACPFVSGNGAARQNTTPVLVFTSWRCGKGRGAACRLPRGRAVDLGICTDW